ncbi:potassium/proton antiporter, partial [Agathobacter sp.]
MNTYLLITSIVIFLCILLNRVSNRIGIPALLAFIVLGMLFGSDGIMKIDFDNYAFAEQICSTALIFIMFYGGFGTNWQRAKAVAVKSVLLSTIGVIITCFLTGLFCHFALNMSWEISFLLGALISSTDAASVFSILRSKKLNLKYNTASLLEVESGSNDPCAYMLTVAFISISQGSASPGNIAILIVKQLAFGIIFGVLIAKLSIMLLRYIRFKSAGFDAIFMVGIAIISYALPAYFDGNGFLSAYIVGIILGNTEIENKKNLVNFFDGITGLMQMLIFFLLGLLSFPSKLPHVIVPALLIFMWLTFVARPLSVALVLTPFRSKIKQQLLVSWSGLRGAASIVFSIMAYTATNDDLDTFHIIFMIV